MKYAQQSNAPEWFNSDDSKLYESATTGTSPFNEWYEFDDMEDAINSIASVFHSESFLAYFEVIDGKLYHNDEVFEAINKQFGEDADWNEVIGELDLSELQEAELKEAIWAESCF